MASEKSFWFRLGYALEHLRRVSPPEKARKKLSGLAARADARASASRAGAGSGGTGRGDGVSTDELVSAGIMALAVRVLDAWHPRRKAGLGGLLRAGAAGAGAALLLELARPLLLGAPELQVLGSDTGDRLLAGVGQGLLYGAVVEPRVPGPPLLKGAIFGSAEYAADPAGGLAHLLGAHAPQGRVPILRRLLEDLTMHDRAYAEHLVFGIALALLYGSSLSSNGIRDDAEEESA